jgi:hypothetical protein
MYTLALSETRSIEASPRNLFKPTVASAIPLLASLSLVPGTDPWKNDLAWTLAKSQCGTGSPPPVRWWPLLLLICVAVFWGLKLCTGKKNKLRLSRILVEEPLDWTDLTGFEQILTGSLL